MPWMFGVWCLLCAPASGNEEPPDAAPAVLRQVIDFLGERQAREREFAFEEATRTEGLNRDGTIRKAETQTFLVTPAPGGEYRRLVGKNGRPLSPDDEAKEEKKLDEYLEEQMRLPEQERRARTEKKMKSRVERYRTRLEEALEVFDFEPGTDALVDGAPVRRFRFAPKPGYKSRSRATKIFARMEGTIFIDAERHQLAKLEIRFREDLKFLGGLFGRVSKGSEAVAEGTLIDGIWLLERVEVTMDARLYFLKSYRQKITVDYDDYRKYTVETEETLAATPAPTR